MTTSTTKTRALCVATRCTTVEQFVATFHRFYGDDETFFVATMMTRPIGLETAFAIQLADKQPVLRGLCVVLDAWNTAENRYKRPGIRLGIKRLTADSQPVFDRLKAASRAPAVLADASPPPGLRPLPSLVAETRRGNAALDAPALPPLVTPRPAGAEGPSGAGAAAAAAGTRPPSLAGKPAIAPTTRPLRGVGAEPRPRAAEGTAPPLRARPSVFDAKTAPGTPPIELRGRSDDAVPAVDASPLPAPVATPAERTTPLLVAPKLTSDSTTDVLPVPSPGPRVVEPAAPVEPVLADPALVPAPEARAAAGDPAAVGVTRFQVALHVDTIPPPVGAIEFQPRQPVPRKREPGGIELDAAVLASLPDRAGELVVGTPAIARSGELVVDGAPDAPALEPATTRLGSGRPGDAAASAPEASIERESSTDVRTPGSALVLPANPLHDLSDQSLEGFVDCTIYEESGNIFHPGLEVSEWFGETGERRVDGIPRTAAAQRSTGPVAIGPAAAAIHGSMDAAAAARRLDPGAPATVSVSAVPASRISAAHGLAHPRMGTVPPALAGDAPSAGLDGHAPWRLAAGSSGDARLQVSGPPGREAGGSQVQSAAHAAAQLIGLRRLPGGRELVPWLRWTLIAGSTLLAIVLAFVTARVVRGPERGPTSAADAEPLHPAPPPPPSAEVASAVSAVIPAPPAPVSTVAATASAAPQVKSPAAASAVRVSPPASAAPASAATASAAPASAAPASPAPGAPPASPTAPAPADDPAITAVASVKLASRAGAGPVVGGGPCRFSVATTPNSSQIRLDDQLLGVSPLVIAASCERHKLDVAHARYQSITRSLTLSPEHPQELEISLPRPIHTVTVTSFPPGARLLIDGRAAGTTPAVLQIVGFSVVSMTLSKPGFPTVTRKVYSKQAQDRVFVKLSAER